MANTPRLTGFVDVDGQQYDWELRSEPQWGEAVGWKGMTVALLRKHTQRGALLAFPPPKSLLKGLQRATVTPGIRAALLAGWEPGPAASRWFSWSMRMATRHGRPDMGRRAS